MCVLITEMLKVFTDDQLVSLLPFMSFQRSFWKDASHDAK